MHPSSDGPETLLPGGCMSQVVLSGDRIKRTATPASTTIQELLSHLRSKGLDWVPEPLGFDDSGREMLGYIEGQTVDGVPPDWFWSESLLKEVAQKLRQFHDATTSFDSASRAWNWESALPAEVILHRDFAPYNCIFKEERFVGLIDFDLCAPGPRIWDIAYTAYRFVPLMPQQLPGQAECWSVSLFDARAMIERLEAFLASYGPAPQQEVFSAEEVITVSITRLDAMIDWIENRILTHPDAGLTDNAKTYTEHRVWLAEVKGQLF